MKNTLSKDKSTSKEGLSLFHFVFLWFGAAVSIAEILTGGLIAPLGFKTGILVILAGHLIGCTILILGGIIGVREKLPAITSTKISFGRYGTYLFALLNVLQLIGWTAVMIKAASASVNVISKSIWNVDSLLLWTIAIGVLTAIWVWFGTTGMKKLNSVAVALLFILTLVLGSVIFKNSNLLTNVTTGTMSIGGALELSIVMPLSWLPLIADYTRFAKSEKAGVYGSFAGYFLGSCWMFIIGLGAAIVSNNPDPSAMMLAANLGITAVGIVVLSTVTTTFMDVYSAGVSFLNIMPKLNEKMIGLIMTVIGTVMAIIIPMEQYESFLYIIGSVFAPLFAVLLADYFIKKNTKIDENLVVNIGAIIVWAAGVGIYYQVLKLDLIIGATVPTMIITTIIYLIVYGGISKWKITTSQKAA